MKQDYRRSFMRLKENVKKERKEESEKKKEMEVPLPRARNIEVAALKYQYSPLRPINYPRFDERKNFRFIERKKQEETSSQNSSGQWGKAATRILMELKQNRKEKENEISSYSGSFSKRVSSGLRLAFGSEQAVRDNSGFVLHNFSRTEESVKNLENSVESVFQHTAFQDFQHKQILKLLQPQQMEEFLTGIEQKLEKTIQKKTESIENLFGKNLISPRGRDVRIEEVKARLRSNKKEIQTFRKNLIGINNLIDQIHKDRESVKSIIGEGSATPRPLDSSRTLFLPQELQKFESRNDSVSLRQSEEVKDDGTTPLDSLEFLENEKKNSTESCQKEETSASGANQEERGNTSKNIETNESSPELESGLNLNNEAFLTLQEFPQSQRPKIEADYDILGKDESFLRAVEECKEATNSEIFGGDLPSITPPDTPCESLQETQNVKAVGTEMAQTKQVVKVSGQSTEEDIAHFISDKEEISPQAFQRLQNLEQKQGSEEESAEDEKKREEDQKDEQRDVEIVYEKEKHESSSQVDKNYSSLENFQTEKFISQERAVTGINTKIDRVVNYIESVYGEMEKSGDGWKTNLATPLIRNPLEVLFHLQNSEGQFEQAGEGENFLTQSSVLGIEIYLEIERKRKLRNEIEWETKEKQRNAQEEEEGRERENIHNKAIFDALNEAFDSYRPYGLKGPPLPWANQKRTLSFKHKGANGFEGLLGTVKAKVSDWANTRAGSVRILPQDEEGEEEEEEEKNKEGDSEKERLEALREEKLAILLAQEVEDGEQLWLDYEYEETQTKLDLGDMVLENIIMETVDKLREIEEGRAV